MSERDRRTVELQMRVKFLGEIGEQVQRAAFALGGFLDECSEKGVWTEDALKEIGSSLDEAQYQIDSLKAYSDVMRSL